MKVTFQSSVVEPMSDKLINSPCGYYYNNAGGNMFNDIKHGFFLVSDANGLGPKRVTFFGSATRPITSDLYNNYKCNPITMPFSLTIDPNG